MHRLIETAAPAGTLIEEGGITWRVDAPSDWAGEMCCTALDAEPDHVTFDCGTHPIAACRRHDAILICPCGKHAVDALCELSERPAMASADDPEASPLVAPDAETVEAMADLELMGLFEVHGLPEVDRLRARARAAHEELMELRGRG